jgi:hypothetical protein
VNKTQPTPSDVDAFIDTVEPAVRREEAQALLHLFRDVTKLPPKMWGPSIIGFGSYHYRYESGREGDAARAGFSPRKDKLTIYLMGGYSNSAIKVRLDQLRTRLGKHKTGASCLYISKLSDVDIAVLREMLCVDLDTMDATFPR